MLIYLTGATGLAGAAIAAAAHRRGHQVVGTGFRNDRPPAGLVKFLQLDLRVEEEVIDSLLENFPEVIINAAAISDPAACEQNPEASARLNVRLPATLARLAHHLSARLIHLSTDMVFDGRARGYGPDSTPSPGSVYGGQKLEAEKQVLANAPEFATIVRTTLLTGNSLSGRRSVHEKLFEAWAAGKTTPLFADEIRQPCLADSLAEAVVELVERNDLFGVSHWAGAEALSRYQIGRRILEHFKLPGHLIEETTRGADPKFAARPANLTLEISRLAGKLKTRPLTFAEQLESFKVPPPFRNWYHSF